MKRFFPILLALVALTACPQAGQILGPSNANISPSKDGAGDSSSDSSSSSSTEPPPDTKPPLVPTDGQAASNPIEPKSDTHSIHTPPKSVGGDGFVRLRYGPNFETVLGTEAETPKVA